jgi:hypothetical protein
VKIELHCSLPFAIDSDRLNNNVTLVCWFVAINERNGVRELIALESHVSPVSHVDVIHELMQRILVVPLIDAADSVRYNSARFD